MSILPILFLSVIVFLILLVYFFYFINLRPSTDEFEYVYVNKDGSVRELDIEEQNYLKEDFHGADGNRPYIKLRYNQRACNGEISGYIRRVRVPKKISIRTK